MTLDFWRSYAIGRAFEKANLTIADVGARGGADASLLSIAWSARLVGFEPEPAEAQKLQAHPDRRWRRFEVLPLAIGARNGRATLHIPHTAAGASLRPHNPAMPDEFGHEGLHEIARTIEVETVTLDTALPAVTHPWVDFIKLDIEGIEHEVLEAAPRCLSTASALKVESAFLEQRSGQRRVWDIMRLLTERGFIIADLIDLHRWRRRPVPADPYVTGYEMPYSRGVLAQCDILALRTAVEMDDESAARAILTSAALGYFDHAISIARRNPRAVANIEACSSKPLEQDLKSAAALYGRRRLREELRGGLRSVVPLVRSMVGRLPFRRGLRPY